MTWWSICLHPSLISIYSVNIPKTHQVLLSGVYIRLSATSVFSWKHQTIKFSICLCWRVLATLRFHWFITPQSVKFYLLKLSISLVHLWFVLSLDYKYPDNKNGATNYDESININYWYEHICFFFFTANILHVCWDLIVSKNNWPHPTATQGQMFRTSVAWNNLK